MPWPTRKQLATAYRLGIAVPHGTDRFQIQKLLREKINQINGRRIEALETLGIQDSVVVIHENEEWVIVGPPSAALVRLCPLNGGPRKLIHPTRMWGSQMLLQIQPRFTPPEGFMHPFALEADERLVDHHVLQVAVAYLDDMLSDGARSPTPYGVYWHRATVQGLLDQFFQTLHQASQTLRSQATDEALAAHRGEQAVKEPTISHCAACGDIVTIPAPRERRCQGCRDDGVPVGKERFCVSCGKSFETLTNGAGRWHCTFHESGSDT